jgi:protein-tyrosine-phosphatase
VFQVLAVCTGNLCRSPMAEGILRHLVERHGLSDRIEVASAGTWAPLGQPATPLAVRAAARHGIQIDGHRSRPASAAVLRDSDLLLCMEPVHLEDLLAKVPELLSKAFVLTTFADPEEGAPEGVIDPYGSDATQYEATFEELDHLLRVAFPRVLAFMERTTGADETAAEAQND